jgi:hypothetical protein
MVSRAFAREFACLQNDLRLVHQMTLIMIGLCNEPNGAYLGPGDYFNALGRNEVAHPTQFERVKRPDGEPDDHELHAMVRKADLGFLIVSAARSTLM